MKRASGQTSARENPRRSTNRAEKNAPPAQCEMPVSKLAWNLGSARGTTELVDRQLATVRGLLDLLDHQKEVDWDDADLLCRRIERTVQCCEELLDVMGVNMEAIRDRMSDAVNCLQAEHA